MAVAWTTWLRRLGVHLELRQQRRSSPGRATRYGRPRLSCPHRGPRGDARSSSSGCCWALEGLAGDLEPNDVVWRVSRACGEHSVPVLARQGPARRPAPAPGTSTLPSRGAAARPVRGRRRGQPEVDPAAARPADARALENAADVVVGDALALLTAATVRWRRRSTAGRLRRPRAPRRRNLDLAPGVMRASSVQPARSRVRCSGLSSGPARRSGPPGLGRPPPTDEPLGEDSPARRRLRGTALRLVLPALIWRRRWWRTVVVRRRRGGARRSPRAKRR